MNLSDVLLHVGTVFMGFFAIMNPIANTPVFLGLTADDDEATKRLVARKAVVLAFVIVAVFCLLGNLIFRLFGITMPAFRITGGILVFLIGYRMLQGETSSMHHPAEKDHQKSLDAKLGVAVTPLALPILAGPGTIATAMNYSSGKSLSELFITVTCFAFLCLVTYAFFLSGKRLVTYLGDGGIKVMTRLMGLILAVIGVQMLIRGIHGAVHLTFQ